MKIRKCPLCGSEQSSAPKRYQNIHVAKKNVSIAQCDFCSHYYLLIPEDINVDAFYSEGQYTLIETRDSLFDKVLSLDDHLIIKQIQKLNVSQKKLLDFGCGKGQFLNRLAALYNWKVKGVETAAARAKYGQEAYGLDISTDYYETGALNDAPFDVITLFHVIEHLPSPLALLKELTKYNLAKDGFLVIEVPLFNSFQSLISGKRWIHLDPPLHISHFTKKTLRDLISKVGFTPIKYEYASIHIGLLGMIQSLMTLFGYKKMLITELKNNRTFFLMVSIACILPFAALLECIAVLFKKGGIIRAYCKKTSVLEN